MLNTSLSISIPTYNRAEFLDYSLSQHIPKIRQYGIEIIISDNASTDHTKAVVDYWKKEYPFIKYYKNAENYGWDRNFELALKRPATEFVWLFGDMYRLPEKEGISHVLNELPRADLHILNLNSSLDVPSNDYFDCNDIMLNFSGIMSCVSTMIVSQKLIKKAYYSRYYDSSFLHTGVVLDYIATNNFAAKWYKDVSVSSWSHSTLNIEHWSAAPHALNTACLGWLNLIFSLPPKYSIESKMKSTKNFGVSSGLFTLSGMISLRAKKILTYNFLSLYSNEMRLVASVPYWVVLLVSLMPVFSARFIVEAGKRVKRGLEFV